MSQSYLTFGGYLDKWMKERHLNGTKLANMTGQKSATSISRFRHDQTSPALCGVFLEILQEKFPDMTDNELRQFELGIALLKTGPERFRVRQAMDRFLFFNQDLSVADTRQLERACSQILKYDNVDILIIQCPNPGVFSFIQYLLEHKDQGLRIRHYISSDWPGGLVSYIAQTMPFLCDSRYEAYVIPQPSDFNPDHHSQALMTLQNGRGSQKYLLYPKEGINADIVRLHSSDTLMEFLSEQCENASTKTHCLNPITPVDGLSSLVTYLRNRYEVEKDGEGCVLRSGLGINMIPVEVLESAFRRGLDGHDPKKLAAIPDLRKLCLERHNNFFSSSHPTTILLSRQTMLDFAHTGVLSDHYAGISALTPEERVRSLTYLKDMLTDRKHNNLDIRFTRNDDLIKHYTYACFTPGALMIFPSKTDYRHTVSFATETTYCEAWISDPIFQSSFNTYLKSVLIPEYGCSKQEALTWLDEMIAVAKVSGEA